MSLPNKDDVSEIQTSSFIVGHILVYSLMLRWNISETAQLFEELSNLELTLKGIFPKHEKDVEKFTQVYADALCNTLKLPNHTNFLMEMKPAQDHLLVVVGDSLNTRQAYSDCLDAFSRLLVKASVRDEGGIIKTASLLMKHVMALIDTVVKEEFERMIK